MRSVLRRRQLCSSCALHLPPATQQIFSGWGPHCILLREGEDSPGPPSFRRGGSRQILDASRRILLCCRVVTRHTLTVHLPRARVLRERARYKEKLRSSTRLFHVAVTAVLQADLPTVRTMWL